MADPIYEALGAAIRGRREALGLSQAKLADRAGLVRTSVTMIESGSQSLLVHQLLSLAAALRVSPAEIISLAAKETQKEVPAQPEFDVEQLLSGLSTPLGRITR